MLEQGYENKAQRLADRRKMMQAWTEYLDGRTKS